MSLEDQLRSVLAAPAESLTLDFKEAVGWSSLHNRLELARDIACLANRSGGLLVLGVKDKGSGTFENVGLAAEDDLPDPTVLGQVLANHFDPPPAAEVAEFAMDSKRFGVIT